VKFVKDMGRGWKQGGSGGVASGTCSYKAIFILY